MRSLVKDFFTPNLFILNIFGLYTRESNGALFEIYSWFVYWLVLMPPPVLATLFFILDGSADFDKLTESAFTILEWASFVFKAWPFVYKIPLLRKVIYTMDQPIFNEIKNRQDNLIRDGIRTCKSITLAMLLSSEATVTTWSMTPIILGNASLPLVMWIPFQFEDEGSMFYSIYWHTTIGVLIGGVTNAAMDTLITGLMYLATIQLRILKDNLQHIYEDVNQDNVFPDQISGNKLVYENIVQCIKHYDAILKFVDNYHRMFSSGIFCQFSASMFVICLSCFKLMTVEPLSYQFYSMIIFVFTMLMELYFYCIFGNILHEESKDINTAAYMGQWYKYDAKSQKALIIFMERAQRPITIKAGGFLDLSLQTFTTLIKRTYSLLTALQNTKE